MVWNMEHAFGQFGSAPPAASPALPPYSLRGHSVEKREGLDTVQALFSNSQNTSVLPTLF